MKKINCVITAFITGALLLMTISVASSVYYAHKSKDISMIEQLNIEVTTLYDKQDKMETALKSLSVCLSKTDTISQENQIAIMNSLKEDYGFSYIARTNTDGYAFNNEGKTDIYLGERDYFKEGMKGVRTTSLISQGLVDSSNSYLLTAVPVYKNSNVDGIVHGSYSTDNYFSDIMISDYKNEMKIFLLDQDGNILVVKGLKETENNIEAYIKNDNDRNQFLQNISRNNAESIDLRINGTRYCAAGMELNFDNNEFYVVLAKPTEVIPISVEGFWHSAGIMLSVNIILMILLLIASYAMWRIKLNNLKIEMEKKHFEALDAEQKMYHSIIDETETAIAVIDVETYEVLYANKIALNYIATDKDEFVGAKCHLGILNRENPCEECPIRCSDVESRSRELEINGRQYHQDFKMILWEGRKAVVEYNHDITEQKRNLRLLAQQKGLQDEILDTIPAGIMVFKFTEKGIQIVTTNRSILEMMGMDKEKALGEAMQNITSLTHPEDIQIVMDAARKLSEEGAYVEYEYRHFFRSRNEYIWVLGQGRSIRNPDGYVYAYVNYTDITARKEVELLQGKLEKAGMEAATKAEFYSQMSHDMRTPMNGILGIAELASEEDDVDVLHRDIDKIKQSGRYMLNLINDTLDLQRMETGRMKLEPTIVRCQDMLEEVVAMMTPSIQEKNLSLQVKVLENSEMNWYVRVDALRIKQIASNIISNSVKYTKAGGTIDIIVGELSRDDMVSHDLIQIKDNGVGMSKEFLENEIFKPFSQERNEMSMLYPGSGLGLSIVKKLVALMGGRIEVESTLGVGTTTSIYLDMEMVPDDEAIQVEQKQLVEQDAIKENMEGRRILLCEDHPLNAEITKRLLQKVNCTVEWAENGEIGVEIFNKSEPGYFDAILMDIRMPVMDGLQAARAIRTSGHTDAKTIPIIAMSANAYEEDIQKSMEVGMNEHLAKPVNPQLLYDILSKYFEIITKPVNP